jgi:hypothetical protein
MRDDGVGVEPRAVDEPGVAPVLEALPDDIDAGRGRDAAVLLDCAGPVGDREVQPRIVRAVTGRCLRP